MLRVGETYFAWFFLVLEKTDKNAFFFFQNWLSILSNSYGSHLNVEGTLAARAQENGPRNAHSACQVEYGHIFQSNITIEQLSK